MWMYALTHLRARPRATVRWLAIVPWFAVLFGALAGLSMFRASNAAPGDTSTYFVRDRDADAKEAPLTEDDEKNVLRHVAHVCAPRRDSEKPSSESWRQRY